MQGPQVEADVHGADIMPMGVTRTPVESYGV